MLTPKIGQGTGHKGTDLNKFDEETKIEIENIRFAVELGLTLIDTAEAYADGRTEIIIGKAIKSIRKDVLIASKFSPQNHAPEKVVLSVKNSLNRLDSDYLDLYQIHWPNNSIPLQETLEAMWQLQESGLIRHVGLCNFNLSQLQKAFRLAKQSNNKIYSVQIKFNLIDQFAFNQIKDFCTLNDIKILAYSPIKNLLNLDKELLENLKKISSSLNATPIQLALSWITSHQNVIAIPESSKKENLIEISKSSKILLPSKLITEIGELFSNRVIKVKTSKIASKNERRESLSGGRRKAEIERFSEDFCPSVVELATEIQVGEFLQPILIRKLHNSLDKFEIIEGELRFWSFVYHFGPDSEIPSIVL